MTGAKLWLHYLILVKCTEKLKAEQPKNLLVFEQHESLAYFSCPKNLWKQYNDVNASKNFNFFSEHPFQSVFFNGTHEDSCNQKQSTFCILANIYCSLSKVSGEYFVFCIIWIIPSNPLLLCGDGKKNFLISPAYMGTTSHNPLDKSPYCSVFALGPLRGWPMIGALVALLVFAFYQWLWNIDFDFAWYLVLVLMNHFKRYIFFK